MKMIAIDPSSTKTGYAVMEYGRLIEAGLLTGDRQRDRYTERVDAMCLALNRLLDEYKPLNAVIELSSGAPGTGSRSGASASLIMYGYATGAIDRELMHHPGVMALWRYTEQEWIGRRGGVATSKKARQATVQALYRDYDPQDDKGGDVSDAICLGLWFERGACDRKAADFARSVSVGG